MRGVHRISLPAHVTFPGFGAGFAPTPGFFLATEGAADFSARGVANVRQAWNTAVALAIMSSTSAAL